jgi:predicted phosphoribosyltransferase
MGRLIEDNSLKNRVMVFADRSDAGKRLAKLLDGKVSADAMVLAIPAGGVPVACEIAAHLNLAMDLIIVRKIQLPDNTEAGFGAIGPAGESMLNERMVLSFGLSEAVIEQQIAKAWKNVDERNRKFRQGKPFPELKDRTVVIVDDGLAAGSTMTVAVQVAREKGARKIIVAVPTAPTHTVETLLPLVDEIFCLNVRGFYPFAVAEAYRNWYDVDDDEVLSLMNRRIK